MSKVTFATVWLDGCSGCHMSFLDMDERLVELADKVDVVFSPLVDNKEFPEQVDVTLVEGAVATDEDVKKIKMVRSRTKVLVSLGDCAVTGNVPSMRNTFKLEAITRRAYSETVDLQAQVPTEMVPRLLARVSPVHEVVKVDVCLPGCPPSADTIYYLLTEMLEGRPASVSARSRFGA
jgi:NAD-reducing hydrogenase small subunit